MASTAHSSSEQNEGKRIPSSKRVKEFKFKDEDDLLTKKFETRFHDDLEAILGADFIGMFTILPTEFEKTAGIEELDDDDYFNVFPRQECLFLDQDSDENVLFEKLDEVIKSHLRPLHIKADIVRKMANRVLVDGGAAINLLLESVLVKFGITVD